jgi:phosphatidylinositol alpha-1,6-mannosyltransferase
VVSVSRLVTRKGHDRLIEAWPAVLRAVPDAALLVVGDGPARRHLQRRADKRAHRNSITFTGTVPADELPAYLAAGDVFALPIRDRWGGLETEGLGLAVLEASAAGLPVVVGRSGGTPSAVRDGQTGHLVDGKDRAGIAAAVIGLLTDPDRARAMGAAGRAWVESAWSWDALAARLVGQFDR